MRLRCVGCRAMAARISPDVARRFAADERVVNLFDFARGELFREREVRLVIFGDDEAAAGFLVEPVDDARSRHAADAAQRTFAMMQQRVDERVFLVPGGGMHDESGGFVDDEQRFVLEQNIERDFFRLRLGGLALPASGLQSFRPRADDAWA